MADAVAVNVAAEAAWRRPRPDWLIVAMSFATFGLYPFFWLYATWRELSVERKDPTMRPVWHALTQAVPIYGLFRFHAHMRYIRELAESASVQTTLHPLAATMIWFLTSWISNLTFRFSLRGTQSPFLVDLAVIAIDGALVLWGQRTLNRTWAALPGGPAAFKVHVFEWVVLILGGLLLVFAVLGSLLPTAP